LKKKYSDMHNINCITHFIASSETPETHNSVNYSSYNSTSKEATVTFWCTESDVLFQAEEFTSVCLRNTTAVCNNNGWELAFDSQERCSVFIASGIE
jgi:hypothetical protein